jgi:hypothetical protein
MRKVTNSFLIPEHLNKEPAEINDEFSAQELLLLYEIKED